MVAPDESARSKATLDLGPVPSGRAIQEPHEKGSRRSTITETHDPDDAPDEFFRAADWYVDKKLVRRGQPLGPLPERPVTIRLDTDVIAQSGPPAPESRINAALRRAAGLYAKIAATIHIRSRIPSVECTFIRARKLRDLVGARARCSGPCARTSVAYRAFVAIARRFCGFEGARRGRFLNSALPAMLLADIPQASQQHQSRRLRRATKAK